jgi:phenylacetate-CoA ligase
VYPAALEGILHRFPEVAEYRVEVRQNGALADLRIDVEPAGAASADLAERIGKTIRDELWFKPEVAIVSPGTLPRSEMKAKRIQHKDTGTKS